MLLVGCNGCLGVAMTFVLQSSWVFTCWTKCWAAAPHHCPGWCGLPSAIIGYYSCIRESRSFCLCLFVVWQDWKCWANLCAAQYLLCESHKFVPARQTNYITTVWGFVARQAYRELQQQMCRYARNNSKLFWIAVTILFPMSGMMCRRCLLFLGWS